MTFTLDHIVDSLAGVLTSRYSAYPVYDSPNPQGTEPPCFFIFFMPSTIEGQVGERFLRDLGVDIVFVQERNIVNANAEILQIADYLDTVLELFPYSDGGSETDGRWGAALSVPYQGTGAAAGGRKSNAGNGGALWHQRQ